MDYEKAYKDALSRAKDCHVNKKFSELDNNAQELCEYIFPELYESKNERIRKAIYNCVKWVGFDSHYFKNVSQEECLAWLEKQGEQKPTWSEDDELKLKQAIYICHQNGYTDVENWLKSLKPQSQWKPTNEQMENLKYAINMVDKCCEDSLQSLYNDLKTLSYESK